jgi:hypothetical protein
LIGRCSPATTAAALKMHQNLLLHVAFGIILYRITGGFLYTFSESKAPLRRGLLKEFSKVISKKKAKNLILIFPTTKHQINLKTIS